MIPLVQRIWLIYLLRLWPFRIGISFVKLLHSNTAIVLSNLDTKVALIHCCTRF